MLSQRYSLRPSLAEQARTALPSPLTCSLFIFMNCKHRLSGTLISLFGFLVVCQFHPPQFSTIMGSSFNFLHEPTSERFSVPFQSGSVFRASSPGHVILRLFKARKNFCLDYLVDTRGTGLPSTRLRKYVNFYYQERASKRTFTELAIFLVSCGLCSTWAAGIWRLT